jgi:hypothetical protein
MLCGLIKRDKLLEVERLGKSPVTDQLARLQLNIDFKHHHLACGGKVVSQNEWLRMNVRTINSYK